MLQNTLNTGLVFPGFQRKPDGNFAFTMVPNQFLDEIVPNEKPCVIKVVCLILRRTIGWLDEHGHRRTQEQVAYSEFVREMNMSTQAVADGLKIALKKGYIVRVKPGTSYNARGGAGEGAWYSLRWQNLPAEVEVSNRETDTLLVEAKPDSIDQSQMTLKSRDMRNKAESEKKEINLELNSTENQIRDSSVEPVRNGKFSTYVGNVITDLGEQFGDGKHRLPNIKHALNLWDKPAMTEAEFVKLLYQARDLTRQYTTALAQAEPKPKKFAGWLNLTSKTETALPDTSPRNRMPYFFRVLEELVKMPSTPVEAVPTESPVALPPVVFSEPAPSESVLTPAEKSPECFGLSAVRQEWAEQWAKAPEQVLTDWRAYLSALRGSHLQVRLAKSLGIVTEQAKPVLLNSLGLVPQADRLDLLLLVENNFEARYLTHHLTELGEAAQQYWGKPVMFHFLCL